MRSRLLLVLAFVVALVAALIGWRSCSSSGGSHGNSTSSGGSATAGAHGGAGKRDKAHRSGPVEPAKLSGRVTRASDGAGIAGAMVTLAPAELMAMFVESSSPTLTAITDASGAWTAPRVPPGAYVIAATAPGFLPGSRAKLLVSAAEQKSGLDIALTAGGTVVSGTVTDVGGGPIADARITAIKDSDMPELWGHAAFATTTGPDGRYSLTLADGEYRLTARHDEYTSEGKRAELEGKPVTVDFTLIPGAIIRGQVVAGDTGKPVSGALVRSESSGQGDDDGTALTDDAGNFAIREIAAGTIELSAFGRGYASRVPTVVQVGIGEQLDGVKVIVDHAFSIAGTVVRKGHKDQPLEGITLGAFSIAAKAFGLALEPSADDGSFLIVGLKPASYIVGAIGEGSVPEIGTNVEVVDKDVEGVVIELSAGVTVSGRVEPVFAAAHISIEPAAPIGLANMFEAAKAFLVHGETDASGAFTLKNVPSGAFKLKARAPDGHSGELAIVVAEVDLNGLVVKMESRATVAGKVIDTNGKPVAAARVRANRLDDDKSNMMVSFGDGRRGVATGLDGSFKIVGLEAGKYSVRAAGDDDSFETFEITGKADKSSKARVELELTATTVKTDVVLTVEARDGVIKGNVVMPDKKPAADAWVTAKLVRQRPPGLPDSVGEDFERWGPTSTPVLTNADGQFTISKLRRGTYNVVVEGPRGATHGEKKGVKTGDTVTIELAALGTLSGKVTALGKPVRVYDISCSGPHDADRSIDNADGAYTLERLTPGKYACVVQSDTGTGGGKIDIPAGPATLDITLTPWASITGVVVSVLDKKPVVGVHAFAGTEMFGSQNIDEVLAGKAPKTDAAGRFTVTRVAEGKGSVAIMPKDGFTPLGSREYTATAGQKLDVGTIEVVPPRTGDAGTLGMSTSVETTTTTTTTIGSAGTTTGSGSSTTSSEGKLVVASVKDGGPAAAAGVAVGDRILSINGQDVAKLTPTIASMLLASGNVGVGQQVTLALDRNGTAVAATLTSVKW